jgi:hypothetical protein
MLPSSEWHGKFGTFASFICVPMICFVELRSCVQIMMPSELGEIGMLKASALQKCSG